MVEKLKGLVKSRRFWTAIGSVVVVILHDTLGIPEETANTACPCVHFPPSAPSRP